MVEQAKILCDEAEENNLGSKVKNERFQRWSECSLCEQQYHGVVKCAFGWGCWKTYVGRPEKNQIRRTAMNQLANGLVFAGHHEEALSVKEAELSMYRRLNAPERAILYVQSDISNVYQALGRVDECLSLRRDVYSGWLKLLGEENEMTLQTANNYAISLIDLRRFEEARILMRKTMPVAKRVLGESRDLTFRMRSLHARALYTDPGATLDDLREAVAELEETERTARRVLGGAHPLTMVIERALQNARATLRARETPSPAESA